jgi:exosortase/archaeosortase family protein
MNKKILGFVLIALIVNVTFFFLIDYVKTPFPKIVGQSITLMGGFEFDYTNDPAYYGRDYKVEINNLCTGFASFFLLASIIILQKSFKLTKNSWRNIGVFLPISWAILYLINIIRLLIIFYWGKSQTSVEYLHLVGWIIMSIAIFLLWLYFEKQEKRYKK